MKIKRILAVGLCCICALPMFACGQNTKTEQGVVNIMMVNAGYGKGFVEDVAEAFNELYKDQGYKVKLLEPRSTFQGTAALNEMRLGNETGYDLVITDGVTVQQATDPDFGVCVEDMNDVYDSYPINFDGSAGDKKISELFNTHYDYQYKIGDTYWGVPNSASCRGLVCNTKVLESYGITELPVTTDELFEMMDTIYNGTATQPGMRPITWGGNNAYGYALSPLYTCIAQLMGVEKYDEFFKLNYLLNEDGTIKKDGYTHVEDESLKTAIEIVMQEFDVAYSVTGSITQKHTDAHAQIITGKAAFMFDGEYFFNEVRTNFSKYLNDVRFTAMPIVSQLGVNLKLDGSGENTEKCDEILSFMAKKVDEGKTAEEIKSLTEAQFSITLTSEQVARVVEARTTGYGGTGPMYIIKDSINADVAKMFVRMLLSEDAAKAYSKYGMIHPMYTVSGDNVSYQFIKDAYAVNAMYDYRAYSVPYPDSVRAKTNLFLLHPYNAAMTVTWKDEMGTVTKPSERNYASLAEATFNKVKVNVKENWADLMAQGGYKIGN